MADEDVYKALDISFTQVLVHVGSATDRECPYHHRVLLRRVAGSSWVYLSPNLERFIMDLSEEEYTIVPRLSIFPEHALQAGLLYHDPISSAALKQHARAAKEEANLQGGDGDAADLFCQWRFSDPADPKFGGVVDAELIEDPETFSELSGYGLVCVQGAIHSCQMVEDSEFDEWRGKIIAEVHDDKIVVGTPPRALQEYLDRTKEAKRKWRFDGSRVCREWLRAVAEGPGNLTSYHSEWIRLSGVSEGSSQAHEHRQLVEIIRMAIHDDLLDVGNLSAFEQITRRLVQVEMAVEKNPKHPDFSGLNVLVDTNVSAGGMARVPTFTKWVTDRHREQAEIFKQRRLFTEEANKSENRASASSDPKTPSLRAPKPKPGPKGKKGDP